MPSRLLLGVVATMATAAGLMGSRSAAQVSGPNQRAIAPGVIRYFIATGDPDTGFRTSDRELAQWAFEAWARNSAGGLRVEPSSLEEEALVRVYWAPANAGTYGETRPIFVGGRRGAAVFVRPEIDALGFDIASRAKQDPLWREAIVYLTCVHEIGHAIGLEHTADSRDIMYSFAYGGDISAYFGRYRRQIASRGDIRTASGLSDADIARLRADRPAR